VATTASTQKAGGPTERWVALLGRRDAPTDGVEDYCRFLAGALERRGILLEIARVDWFGSGWNHALHQLRERCRDWGGNRILLQYTAMAWSRRGFPFGAVAALKILQENGANAAVVFHEPFRQGGTRGIGWLRGVCQDWVVRALYKRANAAIFADPLKTIPWLPADRAKATFIPIGANIPESLPVTVAPRNRNGTSKTVTVFCLSDQPNRARELEDILYATRFSTAQGQRTRVVFLGRGTEDAAKEIEPLFRDSSVEISALGLQSPDDVSRVLSESDVMLCVRGPLYPRRGSAIAGIACGLPIVAYAGAAAGTPLEDAGLALAPYADREALGRALVDVLMHDDLRKQLHERSIAAYREHFSWDVIAASYQKLLSIHSGAGN